VGVGVEVSQALQRITKITAECEDGFDNSDWLIDFEVFRVRGQCCRIQDEPCHFQPQLLMCDNLPFPALPPAEWVRF